MRWREQLQLIVGDIVQDLSLARIVKPDQNNTGSCSPRGYTTDQPEPGGSKRHAHRYCRLFCSNPVSGSARPIRAERREARHRLLSSMRALGVLRINPKPYNGSRRLGRQAPRAPRPALREQASHTRPSGLCEEQPKPRLASELVSSLLARA